MSQDVDIDEAEVDLERSLGYELKEAHALLRAEMDAVLRPIGLTVPQYASLEVLHQRPGVSNAELARATFVSRQSVNVLLRGLEGEGLVAREGRPATGRARPISLTEEGGRVRSRGSRVVAEVEGRMLSPLDEAERGQLRHLLRECLAGLRSTG